MATTTLVLENERKEAETPVVAPVNDGLSVGWGILFILGSAAAWMGFFAALNYLSHRLLGLGR